MLRARKNFIIASPHPASRESSLWHKPGLTQLIVTGICGALFCSAMARIASTSSSLDTMYRSSIAPVCSFELSVSKILPSGALRSSNLAQAWTSDAVMVRLGRVLNLLAVSLSFGRRERASRKVEVTLTVMVDSSPSASSHFPRATPALRRATSNRESSLEARAEKSRTLW